MNDRSKSYDECCNIIDSIVCDSKMYGAAMVQQYGQQEVWCNSGTAMLHGAAMISNGITTTTWCSMVQHMVQRWDSNGQWPIVHNGTAMVQWYNMRQLVFSAANSWCYYGMAKHNGTAMTLCSSGTMVQQHARDSKLTLGQLYGT